MQLTQQGLAEQIAAALSRLDRRSTLGRAIDGYRVDVEELASDALTELQKRPRLQHVIVAAHLSIHGGGFGGTYPVRVLTIDRDGAYLDLRSGAYSCIWPITPYLQEATK